MRVGSFFARPAAIEKEPRFLAALKGDAPPMMSGIFAVWLRSVFRRCSGEELVSAVLLHEQNAAPADLKPLGTAERNAVGVANGEAVAQDGELQLVGRKAEAHRRKHRRKRRAPLVAVGAERA